jgi:hypothetical protein
MVCDILGSAVEVSVCMLTYCLRRNNFICGETIHKLVSQSLGFSNTTNSEITEFTVLANDKTDET